MAGLRVLILGLAAALLFTANATAQDYRLWDQNNDGVITPAEWRGTVQDFRSRDWNRDGVLSGSELREQDGAWVNQDEPGESFASLDRNEDGRVTRREWRGNQATFLRADRNGDNVISRLEFRNYNNVAQAADLSDFDLLDANGSGRIERDEWSGTRAAFGRMDRNGDGVLNRRELESSDVAPVDVDEFNRLDYNNNGVVSRGEWRDGATSFNRYDVNRDGVISRREYGASGLGASVEDTVVVDARQEWTDTGVYVNAGDVVTFRADGTIQMMTGTDDRATPAGSLTGRTAANSPRPDRPAGALLVRIGNGGIEAVGANGTFTARSTGRVYLGVNDDHFADNSGEYRVWLSIGPR
jgi:Ca2+-binding EF-hand superfamily protein